MGSQFIRAECYASVRGQAAPTVKKKGGKSAGSGGYQAKPKRGKLSAAEIIAEATRAADATPHIPQPKPPNCLYGETAEDLPVWFSQLETLAADVKVEMADGRQRKQRTDTPILMGVVASYPDKADESNELYVLWRQKTVDYLKEKYGDNLVSVLEHTDEEYGHIHAFVSNKGRSVKPLHDGYAAQAEAAENGASKKSQSDAYKQGGRAFQDDYQAKVGVSAGLARIGPARPRLTRAAWQADKQANKARAIAMLEADRVIKNARDMKIEAESEKKKTDEIAAKNSADTVDLSEYRQELVAFKEKLDRKSERIGEREKLLDQEQADINHNKSILARGYEEIGELKKLFLKAYDLLPFDLKPMFEKIFSEVKTIESKARAPVPEKPDDGKSDPSDSLKTAVKKIKPK